MRLGTYIFMGLIFIGMVGGGVYMLFPQNYSIEILGVTFNLPIAVWVVLPMVLLFLFTVLHMLYYGTKGYLRSRRWVHDAKELQKALYWSLLHEPKEHHYTMPAMKEGAPLLGISHLKVVGNIHGLSDKLMETIEWVKKIESGEYVDLRSKKVEKHLSRENPILVHNQLNRLEGDREFVETVLRSKEAYDDAVVSKALEKLVEEGEISQISKYISFLDKEHFYRLLDRIDESKEDLGFTPASVRIFAERLELECPDYLRLMRTTLKRFGPEENLKLFSQLAKEDEKAQRAYVHLLFEYEMIDEVQKFLEEQDENEFRPYRALLILKQEKHPFRIDELIDASTACNDA